MLAVDSIFMMPQLGVLSTILPDAATQVFDRDCLIRLGDCIAPTGNGVDGEPCLTVTLDNKQPFVVKVGELKLIPLAEDIELAAEITPTRNWDVGEGKGKSLQTILHGGAVGLIIDCRGRPIALPTNDSQRIVKLREWLKGLDLPMV